MQFIPVIEKLNYSSLQCHKIFQKSFCADLLLNKHFLLLSVLQTAA